MGEHQTSKRIREQLKSCENLPTLPGVAVELLACLDKSEVDLRELANIIRRDPALSAKVLGFLNSANFGLRREVSSIQHAAALLGLRALQTIALSFALVRGMRSSDLGDFDFDRFWKRSILAGAAAQALGESRQTANREELFLGGLLQDIGMLALQAVAPDEYRDLNIQAGKDHSRLCALERKSFGVDHATIGGWLAELWQLPKVFQCGITASHDPEKLEVKEELKPHLEIISISGWLAEVWLDRSHSLVYLRGRAWSRLVKGMRRGEIRFVASKMRGCLSELSSLFEIQVEDSRQAINIMLEARDQLVELNLETLQLASLASVQKAELSSQNEELKEKCFRDSVTNLLNRTYFEAFLMDQLVTDSTQNKKTSVVFGDIDGFKRVNDVYGHEVGDACLAHFGRVIKKKMRRHDSVLRWGGDEFVIVLPNTDIRNATQIAERLQEAMIHTPLTLDTGEPITVTLSVGCASHDDATPFSCLALLVDAADKDLIKMRGLSETRQHPRVG